MKRIQFNKQPLSMSRTIFVPTAVVERTAENSVVYEQLLHDLAVVCGGVTEAEVSGTWVSPEDGVVYDDITTVTVFFDTTKQRNQVSQLLDEYTQHLLDEGEECVLRQWSRKGESGAVLYSQPVQPELPFNYVGE